MNAEIQNRLEELPNEKIINSSSVSGGCIADSKKIELISHSVQEISYKNAKLFKKNYLLII